ncbi:putative ubiquitin-conjugating enzyme E2 38 isoform X1 [Herrania umbratica]|uniref:E2 ubiquitin-conjugating enzyme n=2 Tax=Herrania umbratica TaxID=108875 RepID=A0A6J1BF31_9ROSI|nr:putative ubiquitin-conjugating enzyme E2 38 isoform X1 [Herrania umbratica]
MDLRVDETSISKRLKPTQILLCDAMDIGQVEDPTTVLIGSEKAGVDSKGKTKICYDKKWDDHVKDASASDQGNSVSVAGSEDSNNPLKSSTSGSINSNNLNSSNSDISYHDDDNDCDEDCDDYADDVSDYGDNDDFLYEDDYSIMQSHFDHVDLPPGVEASIPWLKDPTPIVNVPSGLGESTGPGPAESVKSTTSNLAGSKVKSASTSTSIVSRESGSDQKEEGNEEHDVMQTFQSFKHFDVVDDFSDHHYSNLTLSGEKQPKEWAKRIQDEWKILEKDLPDTIYVRVYEARMDLLRAVIIGPSGTPYHDGLFVFDCFFPPKYPSEPPMVYYYSGGLRLNPNLYNCGKVCLSLLGTWHGQQTEMWVPGQSTMLQVLVSIQALILNDRPFFNEPGYETSYVGDEGDRRSRKYNEDVFVLSLKTMIYTLRRPPKHFEAFVAGHFRKCARDIMVACQAYKEGAKVGSVVVKDGVPDPDKIEKGSSEDFKGTMQKMINLVVKEFVKNGSTDCEQFQASRS